MTLNQARDLLAMELPKSLYFSVSADSTRYSDGGKKTSFRIYAETKEVICKDNAIDGAELDCLVSQAVNYFKNRQGQDMPALATTEPEQEVQDGPS